MLTRHALIGAGIVGGGAVATGGGSAVLHSRATEPIRTIGDTVWTAA